MHPRGGSSFFFTHITHPNNNHMPPPFRTDIQALRAVAVLLVVGFHVWPATFAGGYVGVDVFFVISGYLITGHLVREVAATGRVDLATFYARRARRLLPAASLTLVAVGLAAFLWMPPSTWPTIAADIAASTLYAENWMLVRRSVDYLAQNQAPSPLQHFWSLSVEEQFYLGWPLLVAWGGRRGRRSGGGGGSSGRLAWSMAAVCVTSFVASLYYAHADPAPGYFSTATRLWEMGMGGLVALRTASPMMPASKTHVGQPQQCLAPSPPAAMAGFVAKPFSVWPAWARTAGTAGGLAAILGSGALYTPQIPFPGAAALLPVLGAVAFILAGELGDEAGEAGGVPALSCVLSHPWLQYVGDLSYSLYLAHWPVVVVYPFVTGRVVDGLLADGVTVLVLSCALAHGCKLAWEGRFRGGDGQKRPENLALRPTPLPSSSRVAHSQCSKNALRLGVILSAISFATSGLLLHASTRPNTQTPYQAGLALNGDVSSTYPGAEAVVKDAQSTHVYSQLPYTEVRPPVHVALLDNGPVYDNKNVQLCPSSARDKNLKVCTTSSAVANVSERVQPTRQIVLLGDSHAAHWFPALSAAAKIHGWTATSVIKSGCMPMNATGLTTKSGGLRSLLACQAWFGSAIRWILAEKPAAVIFSAAAHYQMAGSVSETHAGLASGVVKAAQHLQAHGIPVLAVKHTPFLALSAPVCLESAERRGQEIQEAMATCTAKAADVLPDERALNMAARQLSGLHLLDFDDAFVDLSGHCPPILGNVVVYRDQHHLTSSYSKTLGPALGRRLLAAVPGLLEDA